MKPLQLGQISYLNVAPIYYGMRDGQLPVWIHLQPGTPAQLNRWMAAKRLDAGPVSTGVLTRHANDWKLLPGLSIGCSGKVLSVLLISRYPMYALHQKKVFLSNESGTANLLLKLLLSKQKVTPFYHMPPSSEPGAIAPNADAFLIIGDKALTGQPPEGFEQAWDLGEIWWQTTGLPFTFAVWVVQSDLLEKDPLSVQQLWQTLVASKESGLTALDTIANHAAPQLGITRDAARNYYRHLHYDLDSSDLEGIQTFFKQLHRFHLIRTIPRIRFFKPCCLQ